MENSWRGEQRERERGLPLLLSLFMTNDIASLRRLRRLHTRRPKGAHGFSPTPGLLCFSSTLFTVVCSRSNFGYPGTGTGRATREMRSSRADVILLLLATTTRNKGWRWCRRIYILPDIFLSFFSFFLLFVLHSINLRHDYSDSPVARFTSARRFFNYF